MKFLYLLKIKVFFLLAEIINTLEDKKIASKFYLISNFI